MGREMMEERGMTKKNGKEKIGKERKKEGGNKKRKEKKRLRVGDTSIPPDDELVSPSVADGVVCGPLVLAALRDVAAVSRRQLPIPRVAHVEHRSRHVPVRTRGSKKNKIKKRR